MRMETWYMLSGFQLASANTVQSGSAATDICERLWALKSWVWGLGFRVKDSGFENQGLGSRFEAEG